MTATITPPQNRGKRIVKMGAISYAHLMRLMLDGVYTCQELADETGLHYVTVLQYTRELHRVGAAHICAWEPDTLGRDARKIYKLGQGRDKPRSKQTTAVRQARYRAKKKARETIHMFAGEMACPYSSD